jgi:TolB-like protein
MQSLAAAGDRVAALQHADSHGKVLRTDFDLEVDPRVLDFADELRAAAPRLDHPPTPVAETLVAVPENAHLEEFSPATAAGTRLPLPVRSIGYSERRRNSRLVPALTLVLLLAAAWVLRDRSQSNTITPLQQSILVAPFSVASADASLAYLREGMVELLSARLADDTSARAVDAGATIRAWRKAGMGKQTSATNDSVARLAARLGAQRVIVGSVVGNPKRAVVSAALITAGSGVVSGQASVEGPTDSITTLVDRLARQLLATQISADGSLAVRTTSSLPALRSFLAGVSAQARGDFSGAADRYERALRYDSTFALAALRLASAARHLTDFTRERRALEQAALFRDALSEPERLHLQAHLGDGYPAPGMRAQAMAAWEAVARAAPGDAEVLYGYASNLSAERGFNLGAEERDQVVAVLRRALQLDSDFARARLLLFRLTGDTTALDGAADSLHAFSAMLRWREAAARLDSVQLATIADSLQTFGPANLRLLAAVAQFDGVRPADGARALMLLGARARNLEEALDVLLAQHSLAVNRGRPTEAFSITRRMQSLSPATRVHLRLRVLDAVFAEGDTTVARNAARELEASYELAGTTAGLNACAVAQWHVWRADTAGVRAALARLQPVDSVARRERGAADQLCAELATAQLAVLLEQPDARGRVAHLDSLQLNGAVAGEISTFAHLALARLHQRLGDVESARNALRRQPYLLGAWPRYLATSWRLESELALDLKDEDGGRALGQRYLELRGAAEPDVAPRVAAFRDSLAARTRESTRR